MKKEKFQLQNRFKKNYYILAIWQGRLSVVYTACIQNFGQSHSFAQNKHIRMISTSVLSGGQAARRLERTNPVC